MTDPDAAVAQGSLEVVGVASCTSQRQAALLGDSVAPCALRSCGPAGHGYPDHHGSQNVRCALAQIPASTGIFPSEIACFLDPLGNATHTAQIVSAVCLFSTMFSGPSMLLC